MADFQAGPLGPYYYPLSGTNLFSLVDAGSLTNAAEVGLYEHVTQLSQIPEGNSRLDIGFHYPATAFTNLALGATTAQSSTVWGGVASRAVDGNTDGDYNHFSVTHTSTNGESYWTVDLGRVRDISQVRVWNRTDAGSNRLSNFYVFASDTAFQYTNVSATLAQTGVSASYVSGTCGRPTTVGIGRTARYVRVQLTTNEYLHIAEVEVLGPAAAPGDTDGDGIPDYLEDRNGNGAKDAGETDFADADTDYDGRNDGEELAEGTDPLDAASFKPVCLSWFRFSTNTWAGERGQLPYFATGVTCSTGWCGQAAMIVGTNAMLSYRDVESDAKANLNYRSGSLRFLYRPDWWSKLALSDDEYSQAGNGPTNWVRLIEAGSLTSTNGFFALSIDPNGTNLIFQTRTPASGNITNVTLPIRVLSGDHRTNDWSRRSRYWYSVGLSWSAQEVRLYFSSISFLTAPEAVGSGLTNAPIGLRSQPFCVGTSADRAMPANGWVDELETLNYPVALWDTKPSGLAIDPSGPSDALKLTWTCPTNRLVYLYRRLATDTNWVWVGRCSSNSFTDVTVPAGAECEYALCSRLRYDQPDQLANNAAYTASLSAGYRLPPVEYRGRVRLITTSTYAADLAPELASYRTNLVGDGWDVSTWTNATRHNEGWFNGNLPAYTNAVYAVRTNIIQFYTQAPTATNVVILLGHVAIPYSGHGSTEDGHFDHAGAWSADLYYANLGTNWTDTSTNNITNNATRLNEVGDGKWDDERGLPLNSLGKRGLELSVGRIDLARMFAFAAPSNGAVRLDSDLLRQYFAKNASFRCKTTQYPWRIASWNYFQGVTTGAGAEQYVPLFGPQPTNLVSGDIFATNIPALFGSQSGRGGGASINNCDDTNGCPNLHTTVDLAKLTNSQVPEIAFYMLYGSYFCEWYSNTQDDFLRACLAMTNQGLAAIWVNEDHSPWRLGRLALGECLGQALTRSVDVAGGILSVRTMYIMGDPTLRPLVIAPPTALTGIRSGTVSLTWTASTEASATYLVYRSTNTTLVGMSQFVRLTTNPLSSTNFTDVSPPSGTNTTYMVRALSITSAGSGSYTNISQGAIVVR